MQYLGNAIAWITATDFLFSSQCIRHTPKLYLATTPPPVQPNAMADAMAIFTNVSNKFLADQGVHLSKDHNSTVCLWLEDFAKKLPKFQEFHGTVHCEASLMGAIIQYNTNMEGSMLDTQHPGIFHVGCPMSHTFGGILLILFLFEECFQ
jgi:hypothetical protein